MRPDALVVTCEHATDALPAPWADRLADRSLLGTHRAYDAGADGLSRALALRFDAPRFAGEVSRLLVDLNRSEGHPRIVSAAVVLDADEREAVIARYWRPYRRAVTSAIEGLVAAGRRVLHVSVHSFTPVLDGKPRRTDVGLLYDPRRRLERDLCARWKAALEVRIDGVVHRNQPYRGTSDGLTTALRRAFPDASYAGVELEVNQRFVTGPRVEPTLSEAILTSLAQALGGGA